MPAPAAVSRQLLGALIRQDPSLITSKPQLGYGFRIRFPAAPWRFGRRLTGGHQDQGRRVTNARISVVLPVHNGMPYLEAGVRSILAQSHSNFELVIGDDGSNDGTTELLQAIANEDRRVRLQRGA